MSIYQKILDQALSTREYRGLEAVVQKELFHQDILSYLLENRYFEKLTFIGGTALRLCYGGIRLSEDLDLTGGKTFNRNDFGSFASDIKLLLEKKYKVPVEVSSPRQEKTNTRTWKIQITSDPEHPHLPRQRIHVDVAILPSYTRQLMLIRNPYPLVSRSENLIVPVESPEELFSDKMIALAFRGTEKNPVKARDLWDIHFFSQMGVSSLVPQFEKKLADHNRTVEEYDRAMTNRIEELKSDPERKNAFEREMQRFLPLDSYRHSVAKSGFFQYMTNLLALRHKESMYQLTRAGDGRVV